MRNVPAGRSARVPHLGFRASKEEIKMIEDAANDLGVSKSEFCRQGALILAQITKTPSIAA